MHRNQESEVDPPEIVELSGFELYGKVRDGESPAGVFLDDFTNNDEPDVITYKTGVPFAPRFHVVSDPALAGEVLNKDPSVADKLGSPNNGPFGVASIAHSEGGAGALLRPSDEEWEVGRKAFKQPVWGRETADGFMPRVKEKVVEAFEDASGNREDIPDLYEFIAAPVLAASIEGMFGHELTPDQAQALVDIETEVTDGYLDLENARGIGPVRLPRKNRAALEEIEEIGRDIVEAGASNGNSAIATMDAAGMSREDQTNGVLELTSAFLSVARTGAFALHEMSTAGTQRGAGLTEGSAPFVEEALRMYPSVALSPRNIQTTGSIGGLEVRKRDVVIASSLNMGRSEKVWAQMQEPLILKDSQTQT